MTPISDEELKSLDSTLYEVNSLMNEDDYTGAFNLLKKYPIHPLFPDDGEEFIPLYEKGLICMQKLNDPNTCFAAKALQQSGLPLTKRIEEILTSESFTKFEENMKTLSNYDLKKDSVVFNDNVYQTFSFNTNYITEFYYPELEGIEKWVFKKDLTIDGDFPATDTKIEIRGNTRISGNMIQAKGRTGAAMLFNGDLEVGGYTVVGGSVMEGRWLSFTSNGMLKAQFISISSEVAIKGTIHPDTLIIVCDEKDAIPGYDCRFCKDIKKDYWTSKSIKSWEKYGRGTILLEYDKIQQALNNGENIFEK